MASGAKRLIRGTLYNLLRLPSPRVLYNYKEALSKTSSLDRVPFPLLFQAYILGRQVKQMSGRPKQEVREYNSPG